MHLVFCCVLLFVFCFVDRLIGLCGFVVFFGFFKKSGKFGGGGGDFASRSPLGKLTSALTGTGPRKFGNRPMGGAMRGMRGGGGTAQAGRPMRADQLMQRWKSRHPNNSVQRGIHRSNNAGLYSDSD